MKITYQGVDSVDLEIMRPFVRDSEWFYAAPGVEAHKLLAYLSTQYAGATFFDIGTHLGDSAHALAYTATNRVESFDIVDKVAPHRKELENVTFHRDDLFDPATRAKWKARLLASALIYLDVDPHNGVMEFEFVAWLRANGYKGLIVLDDIWYFQPMRNNLWYRIEPQYRTDVTHLGHWSGTGIVSFDQQVVCEGRSDTSNWTLVTAFFDLPAMPDANAAIKARPPSLYLDEHGVSTLHLDQNLVIFCEPKYRDKILAIRPKHLHARTSIVAMSFDAFPLTKHRDQIIKNRGGSSGCASDPRNTASYYLFCMARYAMLKQVIKANPFKSTHFGWINICIERMGYKNLVHLHEALMQQRDKFSTCFIDYVDKQTTQTLSTNFGPQCRGRCSMCSGFFTGDAAHMTAVCTKVEEQFLACLQAGYGHADEQLIYLAYHDDPSLFDWYVGDYHEMITNYAHVYDRADKPVNHLITSSFKAGDYAVCQRAIDIVTESQRLGLCTLPHAEQAQLNQIASAIRTSKGTSK